MSDNASILNTWEKILEYASSPMHGTMSRKLRKGVSIQINSDTVFKEAQMFIGETFVRFTSKASDGKTENAYYDLSKIASIRTFSGEDA